mmetsp:Transcript_2746/g.4127  ORF Transcript_2746/g.4127 Transcript_2746/m.4127 type:complete len:779 (+) Transcript_2746:248-2584(+)|eukprot:CAMPEP_0185034588 /NCGR_PEP_ID=MMETSP1103-20130426/24611_1 /TAXON_ID=36769 /ORGANISM="Paraphysomonas bandaiensis, Strain Caron Lab Isolate" /LENGTH=778 /DNA_ID=CAMNT_0027571309 /DNA_START=204 /DNA_END=2540 /DNA_ORIENTATION=+
MLSSGFIRRHAAATKRALVRFRSNSATRSPHAVHQPLQATLNSLNPLRYVTTEIRTAYKRPALDVESLKSFFDAIDVNHDMHLTEEEFVNGLNNMPHVDIREVEARRLFSNITKENEGYITVEEFMEGTKNLRWLRSLVRIYCACEESTFRVPDNYDYTKSTSEFYREKPGVYVGDFADIRATRDYTWHTNYTIERQLWQDVGIRCCLGKTEGQARPWVVYTCGPMGVGKGHVLSWLSSQGLFPLEFVAHVDPDFFKRIMPEWNGYVQRDEETAGTFCHQESAYLQEIAQETAMRQRQHVWVDGSLSDSEWFYKGFEDIRNRFPHYRIAIIYITASEETIRQRIAYRTEKTGRNIPESQILRSLKSPENSLKILAPLTDLVVRISNENSITLKSVEDYSGNWHRGLGRHFGHISHQPKLFPESLGPLYMEKTSLMGTPFMESFLPPGSCKSKILKEGWLNMELPGVLDLMPRWFVLRPDQISYYAGNKDGQAVIQGICPITDKSELNIIPPSVYDYIDSPYTDEAKPKWGFTLTTVTSDNYEYHLVLCALDENNRKQWMDEIQARISAAKQNAHLSKCEFIDFTLSEVVGRRSHNLRTLLEKKSPYEWSVTMSPLFKLEHLQEEMEMAGEPKGATHFRYLLPTQYFRDMDLDALGVDATDPDIMLLLLGGFVHYSKNGKVLGVMTISDHQTQYFFRYCPPEQLHPDDAAYLHKRNRWRPIPEGHMKQQGVKYFTYIFPHESLPTRRFPAHGSFAFLFREPTGSPDKMDRYFSPIVRYY